MSRQLVSMRDAVAVTTQVGARPTTAVHGVDIQGWRVNGAFSAPLAAVLLDGTLAAVVKDPGAGALGAELWGYVRGQWWLIGVLNNNANINLIAHGQGFGQEMDVIGIFERLAIAGSVTAGIVTATLAPVESFA